MISSLKLAFFKASITEFEYALTRPPAPSLIPPKYLTTTARIWLQLFSSNTCKIGIPAVPPGSPSSENLFTWLTMYA